MGGYQNGNNSDQRIHIRIAENISGEINSGGQEDAVDDEGGDKYRNGNVEILGSQQRGDSGFHIGSTLLCLVFFIEAGNLFFHAKAADALKTRHRTP